MQFSWYRVLCHPRSPALDDFQLCLFGDGFERRLSPGRDSGRDSGLPLFLLGSLLNTITDFLNCYCVVRYPSWSTALPRWSSDHFQEVVVRTPVGHCSTKQMTDGCGNITVCCELLRSLTGLCLMPLNHGGTLIGLAVRLNGCCSNVASVWSSD